MKLLRCLLCSGEVEIIGGYESVNKKIRCLKCGYSNNSHTADPEVLIVRKRSIRID